MKYLKNMKYLKKWFSKKKEKNYNCYQPTVLSTFDFCGEDQNVILVGGYKEFGYLVSEVELKDCYG